MSQQALARHLTRRVVKRLPGGAGRGVAALAIACAAAGAICTGSRAADAPSSPSSASSRTAPLVAPATAGAAAAIPGVPAAAPLPPAEAFFGRPSVESALLSPSGRWLALTVPVPGLRNALVILDLDTVNDMRQAVRFSDVDIDTVRWVNDERLVFDVVDLDEGSGEATRWPGLFSVKRDGSELRQLVELQHHFIRAAPRLGERTLPYNHLLLQVPGGGGDEVIVGEWSFSNTGMLETVLPRRLNVVTGRSSSIAQGIPDRATQWWFAADGTPRAAAAVQGGRLLVYWRAPGQETWAQIGDQDALRATWLPRQVAEPGQLYVTTSAGGNAAGEAVLSRFDFATGKPQPDALVSTPGYDFNGSIVSETAGSLALGVRTETDAEVTVWFDSRLKALQEEIDRRLPGRINRLSCRDCSGANPRVLVRSWSDTEPGEYWVWRAEPAVWRKVLRVRSGIDERRMGALELHRIRARDGLDLPVWVTTPAGSQAASQAGDKPGDTLSHKRAAVVLLHGGPWVRGGHWRWEAQAQFLASRGYLVIEPEFRGSAGYGAAHLQAGFKQWGRKMQDDVADATRWAIAQAGADPARICIAGASYGGYATLMGLVRNPELYRCGVAWVAVTDPRLLFKWSYWSDMSDEARQYSLPQMVGDPEADADMLADAAPVEHADRITAPLLLAFGGLDRRVPLEHGTRLRSALRKAGHEPEWVVYDGEGHSWQKQDTRIDFAKRLERFLAEQLK